MGYRGLGLLITTLLWSLVGRAETINTVQSLLLLNVVTETFLTPVHEMASQESYPYCGLYSLSSFLELYRNGEPARLWTAPPIETGFLANAYNLEIGDWQGTQADWLLMVAQKYGAIPRGSEGKLENGELIRFGDWREGHKTHLPDEPTRDILNAVYSHPSIQGGFSGKNFLSTLGVDFRDFRLEFTTHTETLKVVEDDSPAVVYREKDYAAMDKKVRAERKRLGFSDEEIKTNPDRLFEKIVVALYQHKPTWLSLRLGLIKGKFGDYTVIHKGDLEDVGFSFLHAMVAVGHCDKAEPQDLMCQRFTDSMKVKEVQECLIIQNSWGDAVNEKGYVCVSKPSFHRLVRYALIEK